MISDDLFKKNHIKITKQRSMVIDSINELKENATLKNIVNMCHNVDQSTIHRIIDLLIAKNIIEKRVNYDELVFYAIKEEHGHYFTCVKCHKREELLDCPLESIEKCFEEEKGYEILNHNVQINGICKECKNQKKIDM